MFKLKKKVIFLVAIILFFEIYFIYSTSGKGSDQDKFDEGDLREFSINESNVAMNDGFSIKRPNVTMNDPKLINRILKRFLIPPFDQSLHPLSINNSDVKDPSVRESEIIKNILNNKKNGFFVEVSAFDGIYSNTLYFERYNKWTGLIIEADPTNVSKLLKKNRRAWISNTCVSVNPYPEIVDFEERGESEERKGNITTRTVQFECFPLYSYLLALNVTYVDYFSLDIEGYELDVLKTIPFQLIDIETISVEFFGERDAIVKYMVSQGYILHSENKKNPSAFVVIFKKDRNTV